MSPRIDSCDVLVVGGGPVGLLLGGLLAKRGVDVRVVERRTQPTGRSRAIGVHPPGLACLAQLGLADALIQAGVKVRRGRALLQGKPLATIDFSSLPGAFDFVLSVPQSTTERLLEQRLTQLAPDALLRETDAESYLPGRDSVCVGLRRGAEHRAIAARLVVGCDGRHSSVRRALGIAYPGRAYRQRFVMGDMADDTAFGDEARVFVSSRGLVESFPLPHRRRRWVASVGAQDRELGWDDFLALLAARTGLRTTSCPDGELSAFVAERYCARHFTQGRLILAGDAAHVVSPIGGQGMNLGWLDACALADVVPTCLALPDRAPALLAGYASTRRRASQRAARRAELYMALGFAAPLPLRALGLWALTRPRIAARATRTFTMQDL